MVIMPYAGFGPARVQNRLIWAALSAGAYEISPLRVSRHSWLTACSTV